MKLKKTMEKIFKPGLLVLLSAILFGGDLFISNAALVKPGDTTLNQPGTANLVPLKKKKKKKVKHNYYSLQSFNVSGDQTNPDASIVASSMNLNYSTLYRRNDFPGSNLSNLPPFRLYHKNVAVGGFEDESWTYFGGYFLTNGSIWTSYGSLFNSTYSAGSIGDFRNFSYLGGIRTKRKSKQAFKTYDFNVSGNENNADAVITPSSTSPIVYYYRKLAVPETVLSNMPEYRLYRKNTFVSGISEETWSPGSQFFFSNGYIWVSYGSKYGSNALSTSNAGDFRLLLYSDTKRKKKKIKQQYLKRYVFTVSGDQNNADKVSTTTTAGSPFYFNTYWRKVAIPGMRMADVPNFNTFKNNAFVSGFSEESLSSTSPRITDGYVWVAYGSLSGNTLTGTSTYADVNSGTYRVFTYK